VQNYVKFGIAANRSQGAEIGENVIFYAAIGSVILKIINFAPEN
jgi:hypothetical protein